MAMPLSLVVVFFELPDFNLVPSKVLCNRSKKAQKFPRVSNTMLYKKLWIHLFRICFMNQPVMDFGNAFGVMRI